ncbi:MAG: hypothetical protein LBU32_14765 [Clostridiales bacterium]|jgi:hypothetical protein|nr:hypothetical protein [Clostridiales bacterium]
MYFKKTSKGEIIVCSCIMLWIFIVNIISVIMSLVSWPLFFVTILFFLLGMDKKNIAQIFCGGALGLILALGLAVGLNALAPAIGILPAFAILIFLALAIIIIGGAVAPVCCNNIAFAYLTAATISIEKISPGSILNNLLVLIIGGAIILAGSILAYQLGIKLVTPKTEAEIK